MDSQRSFVERRVHAYYWRDDLNCATTTLKILAERFGVSLEPQVIDAALGMHGAGEYGAQCGLVEGGLMFLGIAGRGSGFADKKIIALCNEFARTFEQRFGSLLCRALRPQGFRPEDPPHLCENVTCHALEFDIHFIVERLKGMKNGTLSD